MDPVSIFNALYDTKCLKFGDYKLKSGLRVPYYMNLRRLPLYPKLMDAIVTQVIEKYLNPQAMALTISHLRTRRNINSNRNVLEKLNPADLRQGVEASTSSLTNSDGQLGEFDIETSSDDSEWENIAVDCLKPDPIICGVPYGAIPLASSIANRSKLPFLFDRKEAKSYGDHQSLLDDFNEETRNIGSNLGEEFNIDGDGTMCSGSDKRQQVVLIEDVICSGESILEAVRRLESQNIKVEFVICIIDREENGINLLLEQAGIHAISLYKISAVFRVLEATGRITSKQFMDVQEWIAKNQFRHIGLDPTCLSSKVNQENSLDNLGGSLEDALVR